MRLEAKTMSDKPDKLDLIVNKLDRIIELLKSIELKAQLTVINTNKR